MHLTLNCHINECRSKFAFFLPNARDNSNNCHTSKHQRCSPRRIVSQVSAEASSLALCQTPETMAIANPRWSERSEWNLGYESQRIIAHRRCRLTPTREKKHRDRWDASSKLPIHCASPPHVCCAARGAPTRAASLMLTCINCYRYSSLQPT